METFEILAKKNKNKRFWKTVGMSLLTTFLLLGLIYKTGKEIVGNNGRNLQKNYEILSEIAYPNVDYDSLYFSPTSQFAGVLHSDRFKDLNGVRVAYPSYNSFYSISGNFTNPTLEGVDISKSVAYTRELRQKYPVFYSIPASKARTSPKVSVPKEINLVKEMSNQLVEVAVSFDKAYTYAEIQQKIPSNLKINWYWIGSQSSGILSDPRTIFGSSAELLADHSKANGQTTFLDFLKKADANQFLTVNHRNSYNDVKAYLKKFSHLDISKAKNRDQLTFSGVILTGKSENFAQLENKDWVYSSSIGASTFNQPYYQLDKE